MNKAQGFTLVELVTVIIIIGVLAVNIVPRFDGTVSYEVHSYRTQLIAALRLTQQRAMQQTNPNAVSVGTPFCHQIVFENTNNIARYGVPDRTSCEVTIFPNDWETGTTGGEVDSKYQISFSIDGLTNPSAVTFDSMGRPIANASLANNCAEGCTINVESNVGSNIDTLQIKIESEGYIHAI